jgi:hypothetical protein
MRRTRKGQWHWPSLMTFGMLALSLLGCLPIQPVAFKPFADGQDSVLVEPMVYSIENTGEKIIVPIGFVTDFASTPRAIWAVLPPFGTYQKASVIHDYLYWMQECTKSQADEILFLAMRESNVSDIDAWLIYHAVDKFGQSAWNQNKKDRQVGLTRFVRPDSLRANDIWSIDYRKTLHQTNEDQQSPNVPTYCAVAHQRFAAEQGGA